MFLLCLSAMLALAAADSNFTVTSEVTFDIEVKDYDGLKNDLKGQITVGVFGDTAPVSVLNFKTMCSGFKRPKLDKIGYKNTHCHRVVKDMPVHCGDVFNQEGRGSTSIYGATFNDENFIISTLQEALSLWPTEVRTPMDLSSSSPWALP